MPNHQPFWQPHSQSAPERKFRASACAAWKIQPQINAVFCQNIRFDLLRLLFAALRVAPNGPSHCDGEINPLPNQSMHLSPSFTNTIPKQGRTTSSSDDGGIIITDDRPTQLKPYYPNLWRATPIRRAHVLSKWNTVKRLLSHSVHFLLHMAPLPILAFPWANLQAPPHKHHGSASFFGSELLGCRSGPGGSFFVCMLHGSTSPLSPGRPSVSCK